MKVLIACDVNSNPNPFVRTLADGLRQSGCLVTCSIKEFWTNGADYDIVHLQWPDLLSDKKDVELRESLCSIKGAGVPVVITCHNLYAHGHNPCYEQVYKTVYEMTDCFVHMGKTSKQICESKYPSAKHVIIPHHTYDNIYKKMPTRQEALKRLKLSKDCLYILCMGAFRNDEERELVAYVANCLKNEDIVFLAPNYQHFRMWNSKRHLPAFRGITAFLYNRLSHRNIVFCRDMVKDDELPYYYAASDIALIHRNDILNSGNLPMAFLFEKPVVGPSVGNVGEILTNTDNVTFSPHDKDSVVEAIMYMRRRNYLEIGKSNRDFAMKYWSIRTCALKHVELYESLIRV